MTDVRPAAGSRTTLLVEVGIEEAPSWFIESTLAAIQDIFAKVLERERLPFASLRALATPRRIALVAEGLAARQPDASKQVTGPPARAAVGPDGAFLPPAVKFAEKQGGSARDLVIVETGKGKYVALSVHVEGRPAGEIVARIVPEIFSEKGLPHLKSMRWGEGTGPFVRPVHWLLVLLGGEVVPCELFGIRSDRFTVGHRFHAPGKIAVESAAVYEAKLREAGVIVDPAARRRAVRDQLLARAAEAGGTLVEEARLEEEVTNLVEWPVVVRGEFDRKFLALPPEVTITVMARHQRYFAVKDGGGALLPCFLAVANMDPAFGLDGAAARDEILRRRASMTRGYERVLTARLEDGVFFFEEDGKKTLEERLPALEGIVFQRGAGDYRMKARRVEAVARLIAGGLGMDAETTGRCARAALLCKCDLATGMVIELTELQGIMGGIYARRDGEDPAVAGAVAEHYLPASAGDPLPSSTEGAVVSIADKIDSLMTFISLGYRPSSASDPLGFRRLCLGILRVVLEKGFRIDLRKLASQVREVVEKDLASVRPPRTEKDGKPKSPPEDPVAFFMAFLEDRLKVFWRDRARADILEAALACGVDDIVKADRRLGALLEFQKLPFFDDLAVAFKRAYRISREIAGRERTIDPHLFEKEEEHSLFDAVMRIMPMVASARNGEDYITVYDQFTELRIPIDKYFENVFVNVEDEAVKLNRLSMMKMIADLVEGTARLDLVQFERTKIT